LKKISTILELENFRTLIKQWKEIMMMNKILVWKNWIYKILLI